MTWRTLFENPSDAVWVAEQDQGKYRYQAIGRSRDEALRLLASAWRKNRASFPKNQREGVWTVEEFLQDATVVQVHVGKAYREWEELR